MWVEFCVNYMCLCTCVEYVSVQDEDCVYEQYVCVEYMNVYVHDVHVYSMEVCVQDEDCVCTSIVCACISVRVCECGSECMRVYECV